MTDASAFVDEVAKPEHDELDHRYRHVRGEDDPYRDEAPA